MGITVKGYYHLEDGFSTERNVIYQGILGLQTAFFVVFAKGEVIIKTIIFDRDFFNFQIRNLTSYYLNYFLPSVIGTKI